ncbi:MAG: hydroxyquinol 1,2-dioxygenase [Alphaproteobacteria bacterium]|nr:hydroxyquinol 1,2-dioxygenase [Alphaproteobacteria bacterium]
MSEIAVIASNASNRTGYRSFELGSFKFSRDEYFVYIEWPSANGSMTHYMSADIFLRAMMRDVAWQFFYNQINFDAVFGTNNLYGTVEMFAGSYNEAYKDAGIDLKESFETPIILATFKEILDDWTNDGFDPFAAPEETGTAWLGKKNGHNRDAINRERQVCKRMVGLPGDTVLRTDENGYPVNRAFEDVSQDQPEVHVEPGYESEIGATNLFAYLARSDVTWNPSITSVCKTSLYCMTTEEYILPVKHGNDRVEWFVQLSDEIKWEVEDFETGRPRAKVIMKAGDVASMPEDIRHQGFSQKRSMLLVWENTNPGIVEMHRSGKLKSYPVDF